MVYYFFIYKNLRGLETEEKKKKEGKKLILPSIKRPKLLQGDVLA